MKVKFFFLGGPLSFLKGLRKAFVDTLGLKEGETAVFPKEAPVFVALGCALFAFNSHDDFTIESVIKKIENAKTGNGIVTGQPLFNSKAEYEEFILRHKKCVLEYADLHTYKGNAYLGIDAGSTTTKLILITEDCRILYQHYSSNKGQPLDRIADKLKKRFTVK